MINTFFGFKLDQERTFNDKGQGLVVTKLRTFPCSVSQIKRKEKDGYQAIVIAIPNKKSKTLKHREKLRTQRNSQSSQSSSVSSVLPAGRQGCKKKHSLKEIKVEDTSKFEVGDILTVSQVFKVGDKVAVTGKTKGKGFAGVIKRWGFKGGPRTHGQSDRQRAPGSIGQGTDPGRIWKGKKMPGRMGGKTKTIKGLSVFKIDEEKQELWLQGLVPGGRKGLIKIKKLN